MTDPSNYLDAVQARCDAATEGPWSTFRDVRKDGREASRIGGIPKALGYETDIAESVEQADAAFIAHARTDVPRLVAAVEAVLGWHYIDSGMDGERICSHDGRNWPCPTIRAMQTALGGTS